MILVETTESVTEEFPVSTVIALRVGQEKCVLFQVFLWIMNNLRKFSIFPSFFSTVQFRSLWEDLHWMCCTFDHKCSLHFNHWSYSMLLSSVLLQFWQPCRPYQKLYKKELQSTDIRKIILQAQPKKQKPTGSGSSVRKRPFYLKNRSKMTLYDLWNI